MDFETINLYAAIHEMRKLSAQGKSFSFAHATYNRDYRSTRGIRHVNNAILRPAASKDDIRSADHKLFYTDLDMDEPRVCWQPAIMYFNDKRIVP